MTMNPRAYQHRSVANTLTYQHNYHCLVITEEVPSSYPCILGTDNAGNTIDCICAADAYACIYVFAEA